MGLLKRFKMKTTPPDLHTFIGRYVLIPGQDKPIMIAKLVGNVGKTLGTDNPKPQYYEINDEYLISMLRFHAQMNGDKSITEDQFKAFEEMEFSAEKNPQEPPKKLMGQL